MQLSTRLETICSMAEGGTVVADIGTDHGYVPIELVRRGRFERAIAMDVRKGPLERAAEHVAAAGLSEKIETRLSNGFDALKPGEADTVVIAGMGGPLMAELLERGRECAASTKRLILSPQSEVGGFHRYLMDNGYLVEDESWIKDDNKFYVVMRVVSGTEENWSEEELAYGRIPLKAGSEVLLEMLEKEIRTAELVLGKLALLHTDSAEASRREAERKRALAMSAAARCKEGLQ